MIWLIWWEHKKKTKVGEDYDPSIVYNFVQMYVIWLMTVIMG